MKIPFVVEFNVSTGPITYDDDALLASGTINTKHLAECLTERLVGVTIDLGAFDFTITSVATREADNAG